MKIRDGMDEWIRRKLRCYRLTQCKKPNPNSALAKEQSIIEKLLQKDWL